MTREELKEHCEKQIEMCEMWAIVKGENACGKVYEEHELILELLEQSPKIGKWIKHKIDKNRHICSVCGQFALQTMTGCLVNRYLDDYLSEYCPSCGAKMEEVKNDTR